MKFMDRFVKELLEVGIELSAEDRRRYWRGIYTTRELAEVLGVDQEIVDAACDRADPIRVEDL